jgi:hypothetical protein
MPNDRIRLLQGTLDVLILRTLLFGPAHGHQIAKQIQRTTEDLLQVEDGSLYNGPPPVGAQSLDCSQIQVLPPHPGGQAELVVGGSRSGRNSSGPWRALCGPPRRFEMSLWKHRPRRRPTIAMAASQYE